MAEKIINCIHFIAIMVIIISINRIISFIRRATATPTTTIFIHEHIVGDWQQKKGRMRRIELLFESSDMCWDFPNHFACHVCAETEPATLPHNNNKVCSGRELVAATWIEEISFSGLPFASIIWSQSYWTIGSYSFTTCTHPQSAECSPITIACLFSS